jgi:hypothetical protein
MKVNFTHASTILAKTMTCTFNLPIRWFWRINASGACLSAAINVCVAVKANTLVLYNNAIAIAVDVAAIFALETLVAAAFAVLPRSMALAVMCGTVITSPTLVTSAAVGAAHAIAAAVEWALGTIGAAPLADASTAAVTSITVSPRGACAVVGAASHAAALTTPTLEALAHTITALTVTTAVVRAHGYRAIQASPAAGTGALASGATSTMETASCTVVFTAVNTLEVGVALASARFTIADAIATARRPVLRCARAKSNIAGLSIPLTFANTTRGTIGMDALTMPIAAVLATRHAAVFSLPIRAAHASAVGTSTVRSLTISRNLVAATAEPGAFLAGTSWLAPAIRTVTDTVLLTSTVATAPTSNTGAGQRATVATTMSSVALARTIVALAIATADGANHLCRAGTQIACRACPASTTIADTCSGDALAVVFAALGAVLELTASTIVVLGTLTVVAHTLTDTIALSSAIYNGASIKLAGVADVAITTPACAIIATYTAGFRCTIQWAFGLNGTVISTETRITFANTSRATETMTTAQSTVNSSGAHLDATSLASIAGIARTLSVNAITLVGAAVAVLRAGAVGAACERVPALAASASEVLAAEATAAASVDAALSVAGQSAPPIVADAGSGSIDATAVAGAHVRAGSKITTITGPAFAALATTRIGTFAMTTARHVGSLARLACGANKRVAITSTEALGAHTW